MMNWKNMEVRGHVFFKVHLGLKKIMKTPNLDRMESKYDLLRSKQESVNRLITKFSLVTVSIVSAGALKEWFV
jgi:hypothetical protein